MSETLKAPFPYFGGKSKVADVVWRAFGDVPNYVEPFAGSLAVLLGRPHEPKIETVNDLDCHVANFWRAVKHDPSAVADHCDWPVNEADVHARSTWLAADLESFRAFMHSDPDHFDAKRAGWWVWGVSSSIDGNWLRSNSNAKPRIIGWSAGQGIHGSHGTRPTFHPGQGVHSRGRLPALGTSGRGVHSPERAALIDWMGDLASRLRRTRVACGDWTRVVTGAVTGASNMSDNMGMRPCGVFLDPPYSKAERDGELYREDAEGVAAAVREWAIANGDNKVLRIALCGYSGEHDMPASWTEHAWKAHGGYGNRHGAEANENATRERIWFSPHCLSLEAESKQVTIFERLGS